jgi:hypothetical protein
MRDKTSRSGGSRGSAYISRSRARDVLIRQTLLTLLLLDLIERQIGTLQ